MIYTSLSRVQKYDHLVDKLTKAYDFLSQDSLQDLALGKQLIDGEDIFALVQSYQTVPAEQVKFESHEQYVDLQFIVSGQERMGIADRGKLNIVSPYNPAKDVSLYADPPEYGSLVMNAGDLVVLLPEEAHKPKCQCGESQTVKKIVIKIRI
jgi:biofilm protein TabA